MAFLKFGPVIFLCVSCGPLPKTEFIPLETDTWISTEDQGNHAADTTLRLSKISDAEERILLRVPTGQQDLESDERLEQILESPLSGVLLLPLSFFLVVAEIMEALLDCSGQLKADNLDSATLRLRILDDKEQSLAGRVQLEMLAAPWWQSATWRAAHPFSERGLWTMPGGDLDESFAPVLGTVHDESLDFDVTEYFRSLLEADEPLHFGAMLRVAAGDLNSVRLASVQTSHTSYAPTLEANYSGQCLSGSGSQSTRLGQPLRGPGQTHPSKE